MAEQISYEDFSKVDIRLGKIIKVEDFPGLITPSKSTVQIGDKLR